MDLRMKTGMDHVRSVETYINVSDQEDFILHKIGILAQEPDQRTEWLDHFMQTVWKTAPERVRTGTGTVHSSESAKIFALLKFLANARRLVPYATQDFEDTTKITWSDELYRVVSPIDKSRIERIAGSLYSESQCRSIAIYKILAPGKSGSSVLGVREYEDENAAHISNLSVLKLGPASDLVQEANNYSRLIEHRRTGAFMSVRTDGIVVDNTSGLVYEDAQHSLGVGARDRLESFNAIFVPEKYTADQIREKLDDLFVHHLYEVLYKHGIKKEVLQIGRYINEFLPAAYRIMATSAAESDIEAGGYPMQQGTLRRGDSITFDAMITESNMLQMVARAYTRDVHSKIDIDLTVISEAMLNKFSTGNKLRVTGKVLLSRNEWFRETFASLGARYDGSGLWIDPHHHIRDPLPRLDDLLTKEYHGTVTSPIHGDLHAGNVLWGQGKSAIIDYGRMRDDWPALFDVAYLYADLKSHVVSDRMNLSILESVEISLGRKKRWNSITVSRNFRDLLSLFEYDKLPREVQALGPRNLFYALLAAVLLGRMKFDLPDDEKRISLLLGDWAMRRTDGE
jgi:hypothetical protein